MRSVKQMLLAFTLGCATLFATTFAQAGHYDRRDSGGAAVGLAVLFGIAALAAAYDDDDDYRHRGHYRSYDRGYNRGYRHRGYDHGYYNHGYRDRGHRGHRGHRNHPWRGYDHGYRRDRRW